MYSGLCAEDLEDERLWTALFRIHERTGSALGLEKRRATLSSALIELGVTEVTDIDSVPLPSNLARILKDIRSRIGGGAAPVS